MIRVVRGKLDLIGIDRLEWIPLERSMSFFEIYLSIKGLPGFTQPSVRPIKRFIDLEVVVGLPRLAPVQGRTVGGEVAGIAKVIGEHAHARRERLS